MGKHGYCKGYRSAPHKVDQDGKEFFSWKRGRGILDIFIKVSLSLSFNGHFPGEPGLAGVY